MKNNILILCDHYSEQTKKRHCTIICLTMSMFRHSFSSILGGCVFVDGFKCVYCLNVQPFCCPVRGNKVQGQSRQVNPHKAAENILSI